MPSRIFFGHSGAGGGGAIEITLAPVVVEAALVSPNVGYDQQIALAPVVVEVALPEPERSLQISIELAPVVVEVVLTALDVARPFEIALAPVVVEVALGAPAITVAGAAGGLTAAIFETPALAAAQQVETLLGWEMHRYLNRVGTFALSIPVGEPEYDGEPLSRALERGWRVSLIQENTHPLDRQDLEFLVYRGYVEDKKYRLDASGVAMCEVTGSLRGLELTSRITPAVASYETTLAAVASAIVDGLGGGISTPTDGTRTIAISFNADGEGEAIIGRYQRLLKLGEMARWALRETWELDALEFVRLDEPPDSGYTFINMEAAGHGRPAGLGLIGGTPEIRREGRGIVNRIIPFGSDVEMRLDETVENALTLSESRMGTPPLDFPTITMAVNPTNGRTLIIPGQQYTFTSGTPGNGEVSIGVDVATTRENLRTVVNEGDAVNNRHPFVEIGVWGDGALDDDTARLIVARPEYPSATTDLEITGTYLLDAGNEGNAGSMGETLKEVQVPLTLEHASLTAPYEVVAAGGVFYLEDTDSIARHGLVEMPMHRSDVKNPNATSSATRTQAANVLHQLATLELLRHRAPKLFVDVPLANGAEVWALPGDRVRVAYTGNVLVDGAVVMWEEIDRDFLVIERHDKGTPAGVREVSLTLATVDLPDVDFAEIPVFAVTTDNPLGRVLTSLGLGGSGGAGGTASSFGEGGAYGPSCCDDDTTTVTDLMPPEEGCGPFEEMFTIVATSWQWVLEDTLATLEMKLSEAKEEPATGVVIAWGLEPTGGVEEGGTIHLEGGGVWAPVGTSTFTSFGGPQTVYSSFRTAGVGAELTDDTWVTWAQPGICDGEEVWFAIMEPVPWRDLTEDGLPGDPLEE